MLLEDEEDDDALEDRVSLPDEDTAAAVSGLPARSSSCFLRVK